MCCPSPFYCRPILGAAISTDDAAKPSALPLSFGSPGHILCSTPIVSWTAYCECEVFFCSKKVPTFVVTVENGNHAGRDGFYVLGSDTHDLYPGVSNPQKNLRARCVSTPIGSCDTALTQAVDCSPCLVDGNQDVAREFLLVLFAVSDWTMRCVYVVSSPFIPLRSSIWCSSSSAQGRKRSILGSRMALEHCRYGLWLKLSTGCAI